MKICACGERSVPGLVKGIALCQKHFDALIHDSGTAQDRIDAKRFMHTPYRPPVKLVNQSKVKP